MCGGDQINQKASMRFRRWFHVLEFLYEIKPTDKYANNLCFSLNISVLMFFFIETTIEEKKG